MYNLSEGEQEILITTYRQGLASAGKKNIYPYRKYGNAFSVNPVFESIFQEEFNELIEKKLIEFNDKKINFFLTKEGQKCAKLLNSLEEL